jgi:hypothetical protein
VFLDFGTGFASSLNSEVTTSASAMPHHLLQEITEAQISRRGGGAQGVKSVSQRRGPQGVKSSSQRRGAQGVKSASQVGSTGSEEC